MQRNEISKLNDVLAREREALLSADYSALAPLAAIKEKLLQDMIILPPPSKELAGLKAKMQTNLELTSAALRGVAAAQERLTALETVRDGLTTYDQSGKVALVPRNKRSLEKKA